MKAHIRVDSQSKVIEAVVATATNMADATVLPDLLDSGDPREWTYKASPGATRRDP